MVHGDYGLWGCLFEVIAHYESSTRDGSIVSSTSLGLRIHQHSTETGVGAKPETYFWEDEHSLIFWHYQLSFDVLDWSIDIYSNLLLVPWIMFSRGIVGTFAWSWLQRVAAGGVGFAAAFLPRKKKPWGKRLVLRSPKNQCCGGGEWGTYWSLLTLHVEYTPWNILKPWLSIGSAV